MLCGPKPTVKRARKLRRSMSWPEVIIWSRLRQRPGGFKFRRQHPAGPYVLDFFCSDARLAIEIDGISHEMGNRPEHDQVRANWLRENGVETLRIAAGDVTRTPEAVVEYIVIACSQRCNPLHQPSAGPPPRPREEAI